MSGLWRNSAENREGKYLVKRRDGTVPEWPWFVFGAKDPAAPAGLRAYAAKAEELGMDSAYVADVRRLAGEFEAYRNAYGWGDPDAPKHRPDDPATVAEMAQAAGLVPASADQLLPEPDEAGIYHYSDGSRIAPAVLKLPYKGTVWVAFHTDGELHNRGYFTAEDAAQGLREIGQGPARCAWVSGGDRHADASKTPAEAVWGTIRKVGWIDPVTREIQPARCPKHLHMDLSEPPVGAEPKPKQAE